MTPTHGRVWRGSLGLLAAGATVVLAACGGGNGGGGGGSLIASSYHPTSGTQGGKLVYSDWESVDDLNIIGNSAQVEAQVGQVLYAALWQVDATNTMLPDLASEIPTTQNGDVKLIDDKHMDVTVKLKKGLNWSDGQPLTTKDVKFTWQAICDPNTGAIGQSGWDHISDMEIKDDQTMIWHFGPDTAGTRCGMSTPLDSGIYALYLLLGATSFGTGPVPMHVLQSVDHKDWATNANFTQKPTAVSGPYMVDSFTPGPAAQAVLVPNPHYMDGRSSSDPFFGHKPYLDQLIYKVYGDKSSQIAGLKAGDTDLGLDLIAKDLPALQGITNMKTVHATGMQQEYLTLNNGNNTTGCASQQYAQTCGTPTVFKDDAPLRQALSLAIDRDTMNSSLVGGIGKPQCTLLVSAMAPYYPANPPSCARDVTKANSLLDSDGWTKGSDGTRSKNGKKLAFVISTTSGNTQRAAEEEQLITNWKDIGATVTTKNWPAGQFFNGFKEGGILATGQFDVGMFANTFPADPDSWCTTLLASTQIPNATNPSGQNWSFFKDPTMDQLCLQGSATVDINKRKSVYTQVEQEYEKMMPIVGMYERPDVFTVAPYFGNFMPSVTSCIAVCNAADWFKGKS
jgi:peptide/nickel transport system substrate-binding protein